MSGVNTNYIFDIDGFKYYASKVVDWNPVGEPAFGNDGRPLPFGFGNFSVIIHALPLIRVNDTDPGDVTLYPGEDTDIYAYKGEVKTPTEEGSYKTLKASWAKSLSQFIVVHVADPSNGGNWTDVNCRMGFPTIMGYSRGEWVVDVKVDFPGAFLPDPSGYTGGYVNVYDTGSSTTPPPVVGDPPPPPASGVHYYFGNGLFGKGYFGRGQGS